MSFFTRSDNTYIITGATYRLTVAGHLVSVDIGGLNFATLDVRSAVPKTLDDDLGATVDAEPSLPTLTSVTSTANSAVFTWQNASSLWQKTYTLTCDMLRFKYNITLNGNGRVDEVCYFSGDMSKRPYGSDYQFSEGFNPCVIYYNNEDNYFRASDNCHRWSVLSVPPMFCYAFRCDDSTKRLGLGLVAERGEHNFHAFDYRCSPASSFKSGFTLVTDQSGHVTVDGEWTTPSIIGYGGEDEWDILERYSRYYFTSGIAKPHSSDPAPRFWYGPLVCGWLEQCMLYYENGGGVKERATEELYENIAAKIKKYGLHPSAMIIDDKWMVEYSTAVAHPERFPDMRKFVDRRRADGLSTLLWFKLWDNEGWDEDKCLTSDDGKVKVDPSHPKFLANLDEILHRLLSSDEGCYDADGFKIDFAFHNPIGRKVKTYSGKYGVELLYDYQRYIYEKAKEIKPHALINASPCHPYFAHICDQARLHDYDGRRRDNRRDMMMRARLFSTAMPGVLLDTDNSGFTSYRDTMGWQLAQPFVGVPDLYALRGTERCPLTDEDFAAIAQLWDEYNAVINSKFGE